MRFALSRCNTFEPVRAVLVLWPLLVVVVAGLDGVTVFPLKRQFLDAHPP